LSTRKRLVVQALPALIVALAWLDGQSTAVELRARFVCEHPDAPPGGLDAFLSYLVREGIVVDPDWMENLGLDAATLDFQRRQLAFLLDVLGTPERVAEVQLRFAQSRITCFGVGAVGSWLLRLLLGMGFRHFTLIDHGCCDEHDVARHAFHGSDGWTEGASKVQVTASAMRTQFPEVEVASFDEPLTIESNLANLIPEGTDLVINAADEPYIGYTSVLLSRYCVPRRLPLLVTGGFDAHLASLGEMIVPHETPCADCYADYFYAGRWRWWALFAECVRCSYCGYVGAAFVYRSPCSRGWAW
jgi:molybdopterin-synthase adenylyltransferase